MYDGAEWRGVCVCMGVFGFRKQKRFVRTCRCRRCRRQSRQDALTGPQAHGEQKRPRITVQRTASTVHISSTTHVVNMHTQRPSTTPTTTTTCRGRYVNVWSPPNSLRGTRSIHMRAMRMYMYMLYSSKVAVASPRSHPTLYACAQLKMSDTREPHHHTHTNIHKCERQRQQQQQQQWQQENGSTDWRVGGENSSGGSGDGGDVVIVRVSMPVNTLGARVRVLSPTL